MTNGGRMERGLYFGRLKLTPMGLGPGIHEFLGHALRECPRNGRIPRAELVDAKPKAWHDDVERRRLGPEPDSRGLGPGMTVLGSVARDGRSAGVLGRLARQLRVPEHHTVPVPWRLDRQRSHPQRRELLGTMAAAAARVAAPASAITSSERASASRAL